MPLFWTVNLIQAEVEAKNPDAVLAAAIAYSLFNHNWELSEITQKAYFPILNADTITGVRFTYDKATDDYWKKHMWDTKFKEPVRCHKGNVLALLYLIL